jgi:hypothetical protein
LAWHIQWRAENGRPPRGQADAKKFSALIKDLTEKEPRVYRRGDGRLAIECGWGILDGLALYAELADAIEKRPEETSRR